MISFLITAYNEEKTIGECITNLISGFENEKFEILLACPDINTLHEARKTLKELNHLEKLIYIQDPAKGKPTALNLLLNEAKGEYLCFTDGDVTSEMGAAKMLYKDIKSDDSMGAISARPISKNNKKDFWGYTGYILTEGANYVRTKKIIKNSDFFPVSGYLFIMKKIIGFQVPKDILADDAYISYYIKYMLKKHVGYNPKAKVYVKYSDNLHDFLKQKVRSTGGYRQLREYIPTDHFEQTRSFTQELKLWFFPLTKVKNLRELFFVFRLYILRIWLWINIFYNLHILKKDFNKIWLRVESTK